MELNRKMMSTKVALKLITCGKFCVGRTVTLPFTDTQVSDMLRRANRLYKENEREYMLHNGTKLVDIKTFIIDETIPSIDSRGYYITRIRTEPVVYKYVVRYDNGIIDNILSEEEYYEKVISKGESS